MFGRKSTDELYEEHMRKLKVSINNYNTIKNKIRRLLENLMKHFNDEEKKVEELVLYAGKFMQFSSFLYSIGTSEKNFLRFDANNKKFKKYSGEIFSSKIFLLKEEHLLKFIHKDILGDLEVLKGELENILSFFEKDLLIIKDSKVLKEKDRHLVNEIALFFRDLNNHLRELLALVYDCELKLKELIEDYKKFEDSKTSNGNFVYYSKEALKELYVSSRDLYDKLEELLKKIHNLHHFVYKEEHPVLEYIFKEIVTRTQTARSNSEKRMKRFFPAA